MTAGSVVLGLRHFQGAAIDLFQGDISLFVCDAIVNAANSELKGGGGVDGAIHRRGGPSIMAECRQIGQCPTGQAVVTGAGDLPAKYVIHAVAPMWRGGEAGEAELLASAYRAGLVQAECLAVRHVSFPSLGTGSYGYPIGLAADIAMKTLKEYFAERHAVQGLKRVTLVLFSLADYQVWQNALFSTFPELD